MTLLRLFALALLTGSLYCQQNMNLSMQVINPDAKLAVRVFLDRKVIYEGTPGPARGPEQATAPALLGPLTVEAGVRHSVIVEAPARRVKSELVWTPGERGPKWLVIRYHPGRGQESEPPFFELTLQESAAALK